jgi:hypothetical protein
VKEVIIDAKSNIFDYQTLKQKNQKIADKWISPIFNPGANCFISPTLTFSDLFTCSFGYYSQELLTVSFDFESEYGDNYTTYLTYNGILI